MEPITEKSGVHAAWYPEAKKQTLETLPEFLRHLTEDYGHDHGTICHALAAAAVAAASAVNHSEQGGITGFQAGAVFWEFERAWGTFDAGPKRMVCYADMLYPQYGHKFEKEISAETWKWLQDEASKLIAANDDFASPVVMAHWESISDGAIPFGYTVTKED